METNAIELEEINFLPDDLVVQVSELMRLRLKPGVTLEAETGRAAPSQPDRRSDALAADIAELRQQRREFTHHVSVRIVARVTVKEKAGRACASKSLTQALASRPKNCPICSRNSSRPRPAPPGRYGGSGLGLHICKNLAEMMCGKVGAESETGKGATFWFEAPFKMATVAAVEQKSNAALNVRPCHILLAEGQCHQSGADRRAAEKAGPYRHPGR